MSHAMVHIYTNKAQDEVTDVMKFLLPFKENKNLCASGVGIEQPGI